MRSWRSREFVATVFLASSLSLSAIDLSVDQADVERVLAIARGRDAERARFHAPYITSLSNNPVVQTIEIVTELRRVALAAEEHIARGDRMFAYSARLAQEAVAPWSRRVSIVARLRFHPMNTYVDVPRLEMELDGPNAQQAFIGLLKEPILTMPSPAPGEHVPIAGAKAEAVYDATLIGQTQRNVVVRLDGKEVGRARLDFASVE